MESCFAKRLEENGREENVVDDGSPAAWMLFGGRREKCEFFDPLFRERKP
jgi:hypothetical protein